MRGLWIFSGFLRVFLVEMAGVETFDRFLASSAHHGDLPSHEYEWDMGHTEVRLRKSGRSAPLGDAPRLGKTTANFANFETCRNVR